MTREIAVLVPTDDGVQDRVCVVTAPNAATAKGRVADETGVPKRELRFVQLDRLEMWSL